MSFLLHLSNLRTNLLHLQLNPIELKAVPMIPLKLIRKKRRRLLQMNLLKLQLQNQAMEMLLSISMTRMMSMMQRTVT